MLHSNIDAHADARFELPSRACTGLSGHWRSFVLVSSFYIFCFWFRVLD